jgi:hypothetical protein
VALSHKWIKYADIENSYTFKAWVPLLAYPAEEAPKYRNGYKVNAALWGVYMFGVPVIWWFCKRFPTRALLKNSGEHPVNVTDKEPKTPGEIVSKEIRI